MSLNNIQLLQTIINDVLNLTEVDAASVRKIIQKSFSANKKLLSKSELLSAYKDLKESKTVNLSHEQEMTLLQVLQMKKTRTLSGVTPVTVLTKPFPCPGKCIFCPNDVRMPKSYISNEPGAQRAEANKFDPYLQAFNRLTALKNIGHPTDKVELIILGGTWSSYSEAYQIWFVKRCFDALNDFAQSYTSNVINPMISQPFDENLLREINGAAMDKTYNQVVSKALSTRLSEALKEQATWDELFAAHAVNETAATRCIGLVIETRPDEINEEEVIRIRKLGATKVQIGIQSLNDSVLQKNKRGHTSKQTRYAINLLRRAGFKIHAHWMPNLYGSTPTEDMKDFDKLFSDLSIRPDELKVYPCSLIQSAELMRYYEDGLWKPYDESELLSVLVHVFKQTPRYCRLTRVIRDIPGTDIVVGNKKTNFRQLVEEHLVHEDIKEIRGREIKDSKPDLEALKLAITKYPTKVSTEFFLEYVTDQDKLAAFLRLSLPKRLYKKKHFISELVGAAIIREVHVYGSSLEINKKTEGVAQHIGLGAKLIDQAKLLSKKHRFSKIAVISSIGTKEYYKKHCFNQAGLFQVCEI